MNNSLETLCRPVLLLICETRRRTLAGNPPSRDDFEKELELRMEKIRSVCLSDPALAREFSRVEKPLIFFIDYMVKEGKYPFSADWNLLARKYKELSGDEKFFELLSESIDDPESDDRLEEFFFMMALGFDGSHRNDPGYIERRMRVCAARFAHNFNPTTEPVTPFEKTIPQKNVSGKRFFRTVGFALIVCLFFMIGALACNYAMLWFATKDYRNALSKAAYAASAQLPESGKSASAQKGDAK